MGDRETSDEVCRVDPPISERLRARIDRDFDRRWSQTWGGRFILHGRTVPNDSVRLDGNDEVTALGRSVQALASDLSALMKDQQQASGGLHVSMDPLVQQLRDKTGAGMMDAKKALVENNGDIEASADWLREKGARALLVSKLDEVAWLTNLRAEEMPFQATFRGRAGPIP